jgi:hypothetical protein
LLRLSAAAAVDEDLELELVQWAITAVKTDRRLPQPAADAQLTLVDSATTFVGTSANALKVQVWTALIALL